MSAGATLTTTQAARILQCSRQHVVSLCDEGTLTYHRVGTHRRISSTEVQRLAKPWLTPVEEQSLWLHYAIAAKIVADPRATLQAASERLAAMRDAQSDSRRSELYDRWQRLLDEGQASVLDAITSRTPMSSSLRAVSPLTHLLTQLERAHLLSTFTPSQSKADVTAVAS